MSPFALASLPPTLRSIKTVPLFVMRLEVRPLIVVGPISGSNRRIGIVPGGEFEGERLNGAVLEGGNDWQSVRTDGSTVLDVRLALQTHDGAFIAMTYQGVRHGPKEIIQSLERGEEVDAAAYYFRINPRFETADSRYDFLNGMLAVGVGHRLPSGPVYSVFEVL